MSPFVRTSYLALGAALTLGLAGTAQAAPITINNAGFQQLSPRGDTVNDFELGDNEFTENFGDTEAVVRESDRNEDVDGDGIQSPDRDVEVSVPGWRPVPGDSGANGQSGTINKTSGNSDLFADSNNLAGVLFGDDMFNDLSATLEAGTYTLSALVGDRSDTSFGGGNLILQADGTTLTPSSESANDPSDGGSTTWTDTITIGPGNANIGDPLTVGFTFGGGGQTLVDDFSLEFTAIPEPASIALLGLGGLAMLPRRRRA